MKRYQVTISFDWDDEFMTLVPAHRTYINYLINKNIVDYYSVSMESQKSWITFNAEDKQAVEDYLIKSPLYRYGNTKLTNCLYWTVMVIAYPRSR
jgi:hypothetical protein